MSNSSQNSFLLIDDDNIDQLIASKIIKREFPTLECIPFLDGEKASEYIEKNIDAGKLDHVQFIVVDLMMPIMDGFEFLVNYKKKFYNHLPDVKIIVVSSSINNHDKALCLSYPFVINYLIKPFSLEGVRKLKLNAVL